MKEKVLLHTCCAPCTTQVHVALACDGFCVEGLFYNPNIYPREEYKKRKNAMEQYCKLLDFTVTFVESDKMLEPGNCLMCYEIRLFETAQIAKARGFEFFTTTLLISPFQKHDLIKEAAHDAARKTGVKFLYKDFRPDYNKGRELARMYNLYRQKHCGCSASVKLKEEHK